MYKKLTMFLALMVICGFALSAKAITTTSQSNVGNSLPNCEKVETKLQVRITHFDQNKEKHIQAYNNLVDRIEKFIARIKAKGYDTTKLEADLATLKEKVADFTEAYAAYMTLLDETKNYTCGQSHGDFAAKLKEVRAQLKIVHQMAADIRNFWRTVIRVDLLDIKKQYPGATSNNTSSTTSSSTSSSSTTSTSTP
jgi:chromosome segregation ATPase